MLNKCFVAGGENAVSGIHLEVIWDVDEGSEYDVAAQKDYRSPLILIRTLGGDGELTIENRLLRLTEGTLIVVESKRLRRYRCFGPRWRFWWVQFSIDGVVHFPLNTEMAIPVQHWEKRDFRRVCADLRRETYLKRVTGSAVFLGMLYAWLGLWSGNRHRTKHEDEMGGIIDMMHENLHRNWTVSDMAEHAHMSTRHFRHIFQEVTGQTPKRFYDRLRCSEAGELLKLGLYSVGDVADQLGFSSPFHFSKVFKKYMGVTPSSVLKAE